jgi:hypothetical protein
MGDKVRNFNFGFPRLKVTMRELGGGELRDGQLFNRKVSPGILRLVKFGWNRVMAARPWNRRASPKMQIHRVVDMLSPPYFQIGGEMPRTVTMGMLKEGKSPNAPKFKGNHNAASK